MFTLGKEEKLTDINVTPSLGGMCCLRGLASKIAKGFGLFFIFCLLHMPCTIVSDIINYMFLCDTEIKILSNKQHMFITSNFLVLIERTPLDLPTLKFL